MKHKHLEELEVYIDYDRGLVRCLCSAYNKLCGKHCVKDTVTWNRYNGWQKLREVDRYGRSRLLCESECGV